MMVPAAQTPLPLAASGIGLGIRKFEECKFSFLHTINDQHKPVQLDSSSVVSTESVLFTLK